MPMTEAEVDRLARAIASACTRFSREQVLDAFILVMVASGVSDPDELPPRLAIRLRQLAKNPEALDAPQPLVEAIAARLGTHAQARLQNAKELLGHAPSGPPSRLLEVLTQWGGRRSSSGVGSPI